MFDLPSADMTLICPSCSVMNYPDAHQCRSCGAVFTVAEAAPAQPTPTAPPSPAPSALPWETPAQTPAAYPTSPDAGESARPARPEAREPEGHLADWQAYADSVQPGAEAWTEPAPPSAEPPPFEPPTVEPQTAQPPLTQSPPAPPGAIPAPPASESPPAPDAAYTAAPEAPAEAFLQTPEVETPGAPAPSPPESPVEEPLPPPQRPEVVDHGSSDWSATANAFFGTDDLGEEDAALWSSVGSEMAPARAPDDTLVTHAVPGPVAEAGPGHCQSCGTVNDPAAPFCMSCGMELPVEATAPDSPPVGEFVGPHGRTQPMLGVMTIGRDPRNAVVLNDPSVSRIHCRVDARTSGVLVTDLRSTNGVWVNGRRIEQEELTHGDRLLVGRTELVYRSFSESDLSEPPAPSEPIA